MLEYTPSARITPLQACAHTFFDELREPGEKSFSEGGRVGLVITKQAPSRVTRSIWDIRKV